MDVLCIEVENVKEAINLTKEINSGDFKYLKECPLKFNTPLEQSKICSVDCVSFKKSWYEQLHQETKKYKVIVPHCLNNSITGEKKIRPLISTDNKDYRFAVSEIIYTYDTYCS